MNDASQQSGFAIALLLWMIAGMSLTVAAVIHFAHEDTGMAELRVREAKVQALGRGVAYLLLRDSALAAYGEASQDTDSALQREQGKPEREKQSLFTKQYQFGEDWTVTGTLRPSSGFVSLNNADRDELMMLFTGLGKVSDTNAMAMADGVLEYRTDFPGFRYPEELLAVVGSSRVVYDNVKPFVHAYRTGSLSAGSAPSQLADLAREDRSASSGSEGLPSQDNGSGRGRIEGRITFESIAEAMRNPGGSADETISAAEIETTFARGARLEQTVWVSGAGAGEVLRSGPITAKKTNRGGP
ncbi:MAG: hypothetical protein ACJ0Q1_07030 [Luminiphilus sp.]